MTRPNDFTSDGPFLEGLGLYLREQYEANGIERAADEYAAYSAGFAAGFEYGRQS